MKQGMAPRRVECCWVAAGLADLNPIPLTHPVGFNIVKEAVMREPEPIEDPLSVLTEDEV